MLVRKERSVQLVRGCKQIYQTFCHLEIRARGNQSGLALRDTPTVAREKLSMSALAIMRLFSD